MSTQTTNAEPPIASPVDPLIDQVRASIAPHSPIAGGLFTVEVVTGTPDWPDIGITDGTLWVTLRLIGWDDDADGKRIIRDVKEQQVYLGSAEEAQANPERLAAFFAGWAAALQQVFEQAPPERLECLMPHELLGASALKLKRPMTAEDFRRALLSPARLGALLPPTADRNHAKHGQAS